MKQIILLSAAFLSLTANAQTLYPNGVENCIARWDFSSNGSINSLPDVSNNGHTGTVNNLTAATGYKNIPNTAMTFDGTTSFATVQHDAMLIPQQMSMVAVVKFTGWYSGTCQSNEIVGKGQPYFIDGSYHLAVSDADGNCNALTAGTEMLGACFGTANLNMTAPPSGNYISLNTWYFLASSYDGNTMKQYTIKMDSNSYATNITPNFRATANNTLIGINTQDLTIGYHTNPNYPYWFKGVMDEVAIFNKALSDSEVQAVYNYAWGYTAPPATGIRSVLKNQNIMLYPNPARDFVNIESDEPLNAKVYSVDGRLLLNENKVKQLNVANLSTGIYIVELHSGDGVLLKTDKIVK